MRKSAFLILYIVLILPFMAHARSGSTNVVDLIRRDFATPEEASTQISLLAKELRRNGDRRALFPAIYSQTIRTATRALHQGRFKNSAWVEHLIVTYANIYRRTILSELSGARQDVPQAWRLSFRLAQSKQWSPEMDLAYGIYVHITRDLVEALYLASTPFKRLSAHADYLRITDTLKESLPLLWQEMGRYQTTVFAPDFMQQDLMMEWITKLRVRAWEDAAASYQLSSSARARVLNQLDRKIYSDDLSYGLGLPFSTP